MGFVTAKWTDMTRRMHVVVIALIRVMTEYFMRVICKILFTQFDKWVEI